MSRWQDRLQVLPKKHAGRHEVCLENTQLLYE
jgi:hypothetical protein